METERVRGKGVKNAGTITQPWLDVNLFDSFSELPSEIRPTGGDSPRRLLLSERYGIHPVPSEPTMPANDVDSTEMVF